MKAKQNEYKLRKALTSSTRLVDDFCNDNDDDLMHK